MCRVSEEVNSQLPCTSHRSLCYTPVSHNFSLKSIFLNSFPIIHHFEHLKPLEYILQSEKHPCLMNLKVYYTILSSPKQVGGRHESSSLLSTYLISCKLSMRGSVDPGVPLAGVFSESSTQVYPSYKYYTCMTPPRAGNMVRGRHCIGVLVGSPFHADCLKHSPATPNTCHTCHEAILGLGRDNRVLSRWKKCH